MTVYTYESKQFFSALAEEKLIGAKCKNCGNVMIPQRLICTACHSDDSEMMEFSGKGKLAAFTVISVPPVAMAEAGYGPKNPYCVGIVELEEGSRISAQILKVDVFNPQTIKIGTPVKMTIIERGEEENKQAFLAFEPVEA
ncbi:MAG: Zn-ribbon domain-containing OB-fold protein [Anaerolineae bacterium]|jgi:uncharacterized OB-fold protein|nr:Zn-ribbon domain-containing OB-fold protein [Anaerolineae bacterium]